MISSREMTVKRRMFFIFEINFKYKFRDAE